MKKRNLEADFHVVQGIEEARWGSLTTNAQIILADCNGGKCFGKTIIIDKMTKVFHGLFCRGKIGQRPVTVVFFKDGTGLGTYE